MGTESIELSGRASATIGSIFQADEAGDAKAFAHLLAENAELRAGLLVLRGKKTIERVVGMMFRFAEGVEHRLVEAWEKGDTLIYEAEATFTFRVGPAVSLPYTNVVVFNGSKIEGYRIYMDVSPLLLGPAAVVAFGLGLFAGFTLARTKANKTLLR